MSREQRELIRKLIDLAVRAKIASEERMSCAGCGMALRDWTPGCSTCTDRHGKWRKRKSLDYDPLLHRAVLRFSEANGLDARKRIQESDEFRAMRSREMSRLHAEGRVGSWRMHREGLGMGKAA